jgi:predicted amidohydrolase
MLPALLCLAIGLEGPASPASDEGDVVISAWQGDCADGDFAANLATVRRVVAEARGRGSHFVCFPETFLSGYDTPEHVRAGARRLDDPEVRAFVDESKDHDMVVLVGLARLADDGLYNSILVIHRGRLLGVYDKVMLTRGDAGELGFRPGRSVPVFEAHGVTFGVIVCHDSSFPHVAMAARRKGARLLFSPHYNFIAESGMDAHRKWVRTCHQALAVHQRMVVVRSNVVVTDVPGQPGYGDSVILGADGQPRAEAGLFRTGLITAAVPRVEFERGGGWADDGEVPDWLREELARGLAAP